MLVKKEVDAMNFEFWSGGEDTVVELTLDELETVWNYLEETYEGEMEETQINDFFWFERDFIAEMLGYENFDEIMENNRSHLHL